MTLSRHAQERWNERFPTLELFDEWDAALARKTNKRLLNRCRRQFRLAKGHKYFISDNDVVFVSDRSHYIITCFKLAPENPHRI